MKKVLFLIAVYILFLTSSCSVFNTGKKTNKETTKETKITEKSDVKNDSVSTKVINNAIKDTASIKVPESNTGDIYLDREINSGVIDVLKSINFQRSSGDNSYKFYFDEQLRELRAIIEVGQTENNNTATNNTTVKETSFEESLIQNTKKVIKIIPWWGWAILIYLLRKHIINIIALFMPGVREIKTISDLLNPPNRTNK